MKRLDYLWRLFGTALSFASFGIGGLVLSLTVFPLMNLFVRNLDARAAYAQRLVHVMFRLHRNFMVAMGVLDFEAHNAEALAQDEGVLVVANHPTLLDVVLLMSLMRRSQCIVKAEIWRNPFMRGVVNATGYIRNDGDAETLVADCAQALAAGNNLIVFPEGSRTVPGAPVKLQRGVANIAIRAGSPIRLVTIRCEPPTLMKGQKWYRIPPRRMHFTITVHGLVETGAYIGESVPSIAARRLNEFLAEWLTGEVGHGTARRSNSASHR
ncbi:1-acyl-sn-glycerol-3-phosphate acyltransferase [Parvibaculum sp.]|uniref:lysophospholipid acyltransferase family protein n=1 Tax=Parvibaculum sp. TaxID=2024848 RepID=UPI002731E69B|nr:lysophospholipid acyltransferase family protein [Parvibaculum sp.]MDP1627325.1 lysophospholipid acyltransferase family protein [Parvibaculum sp.]MDP2151980.1 lysophospholipid acyltransferase family protein [Parvibaculum sp.]MDP3329087.1 lysophospholipid acyltransferase family protein [Parvibaculum sp.]